MLDSFRRAGRKTFLLTNSLWEYTQVCHIYFIMLPKSVGVFMPIVKHRFLLRSLVKSMYQSLYIFLSVWSRCVGSFETKPPFAYFIAQLATITFYNHLTSCLSEHMSVGGYVVLGGSKSGCQARFGLDAVFRYNRSRRE